MSCGGAVSNPRYAPAQEYGCSLLGEVAQLSGRVGQPDHVVGDQVGGDEVEWRPSAGEEWLALTEHDRVQVKLVLVDFAALRGNIEPACPSSRQALRRRDRAAIRSASRGCPLLWRPLLQIGSPQMTSAHRAPCCWDRTDGSTRPLTLDDQSGPTVFCDRLLRFLPGELGASRPDACSIREIAGRPRIVIS